MAPSPSPQLSDSSTLINYGGCPDVWNGSSEWMLAGGYEEGDLVSVDGLVFQCKPWPYALNCGQDGYQPREDPATPGAWRVSNSDHIIGLCVTLETNTNCFIIKLLTNLTDCLETKRVL